MPPLSATVRPKSFAIPFPVGIGDPCVWMPSPGSDPSPALITSISQNGIVSCTVFPRDIRVGVLKEGARHTTDPGWDKNNSQDSGVWDYTTGQKAAVSLSRK